MNQKTISIIRGIAIMVIGILIAIFGGQAVMNIYIGVACVIAGALLLAVECYNLTKKIPLRPVYLALGGALVALAIALFVNQADIAGAAIGVLVAMILGAGVGIAFYGIYLTTKKQPLAGVLLIIIGLGMLTMSICWYAIGADFHRYFWIIIGSLIAAYGLVVTVLVLTVKKKRSNSQK